MVQSELIAIRGGGDLGSGVALRLTRCGFRVVIFEQEAPVAVRRRVAFSEAVYEGVWKVEEVEARLATSLSEGMSLAGDGIVPVVVDPNATSLDALSPYGLVDAIMAKRNTGTVRGMARAVVALGPGFSAGDDCDAVVETNRGPRLGRVIWQGSAETNTGEPGVVQGKGMSRVLRAPRTGILETTSCIGDIVEVGVPIARVEDYIVSSPFRGVLRGLARNGLSVSVGMKIGDVDPRPDPTICFLVSDKSLAVAGGVVEALFMMLDRGT